MPNLRLRPAVPKDKAFVRALLPQFTAFGPPPWRDEAAMRRRFEETIPAAIDAPPEDAAFLIAEGEDGRPLGFVHLLTEREFFTGERVGHVSDVAVSPEAQGRGVGGLLMRAAEDWARSHGYRCLTLTVFARNARARELYTRLGYGEDTLKMVKVLE